MTLIGVLRLVGLEERDLARTVEIRAQCLHHPRAKSLALSANFHGGGTQVPVRLRQVAAPGRGLARSQTRDTSSRCPRRCPGSRDSACNLLLVDHAQAEGCPEKAQIAAGETVGIPR